jgi:hypothetical protein
LTWGRSSPTCLPQPTRTGAKCCELACRTVHSKVCRTAHPQHCH